MMMPNSSARQNAAQTARPSGNPTAISCAAILLLTCAAVCRSEPLTKELGETIIKAQEQQLQALQQGKGQAVVTIRKEELLRGPGNAPQSTQERVQADFWFKVASTRTDIYVVEPDGTRGKLQRSWVDTGEAEMDFRPAENADADAFVRIQHGGKNGGLTMGGVFRATGVDFHPETYLCPAQFNIVKLIPRWLGAPTLVIECRLGASGKVTITSKSQTQDSNVTLVLDANHGYRVLSYRNELNFTTGPWKSRVRSWEADYDNKDGIVPQKIVYDESLQYADRGAQIEARLLTKNHREVMITAFELGEVDGGLFTLGALRVPIGTRVYDARRNTISMYDGAKDPPAIEGKPAPNVPKSDAAPTSDSGRSRTPTQKIHMRILYAGHPGSAPEKDFTEFLGKYFAEVQTGDLASYADKSADGFDVAILDYDREGIEAFKPPRPSLSPGYARATVTIGIAGAVIGDERRLKTGYE